LVEAVGSRNTIGSAIHCSPTSANNYAPLQTVCGGFINDKPLCEDFHIYGLEWDEKEIKIYFDGKLYERFKNIHCHDPQSLVIDIEFTLASPSTDKDYRKFPAEMVIDYVRAWEKSPPIKK